MSTYAASTTVSAEKSRAELERTLQRWGATQFMYGWNQGSAVVGFVLRNRQIRFTIPMPDRNSRQFTHTPSKGLRRNATRREEAYDQAVRQRWRALNLVIKAKLEAVESGISTLDSEFLSQLVLPNGQTVEDVITPRIVEGIENSEMPELLPTQGRLKEIGQ